MDGRFVHSSVRFLNGDGHRLYAAVGGGLLSEGVVSIGVIGFMPFSSSEVSGISWCCLEDYLIYRVLSRIWRNKERKIE